MPNFRVRSQRLPHSTVLVTLEGDLDAAAAPELARTICEHFDASYYRLILDISRLSYIASAGAGVLIGTIGTAQENDGDIVLTRPQPALAEIFDILGLPRVFPMADSPAAALSHFQNPLPVESPAPQP